MIASLGPPHPPDPRAVLAALGVAAAEQVVPISGGADAQIWRVDLGDDRFALRLLQPEQAGQAAREAAALRAAAAAGVPVPPLHAAGDWHGRPALLLGWCPGRTLADELRARPQDAQALGREFGRVQAAIHAAPPPTDLAHPVPWLEWGDPNPALRARLAAAAPSSPVLLHLDYHPLNVLVDGGRIGGVLDWANARLGDPRADLARTAAILRFAPVPATGDQAATDARAALRQLVVGWRAGYAEAAGQLGGVADLAPFLAWAGAVMARDLAPRLDRPDLPWLTLDYLHGVRRWTAGWRRRAGCESTPDTCRPTRERRPR